MTSETEAALDLRFHPLTPDRWRDLERLFGPQGADGGCWCMWWRLPRAQFDRQAGEGNRLALKAIVDSGKEPGIMAYAQGSPIGWCSVGPRDDFPTLDRSRRFRKVDDQPVWSIVCFYVDERHRAKGALGALARAAVDYAAQHGARIIESYPCEPATRLPSSAAYRGLASVFRQLGFVEVLRRSQHNPIMRYTIG